MTGRKKRLDIILVEQGIAQSRGRAQAMIMSGKVLVNQVPMDKPGALVSDLDTVEFAGKDIPYASRGGLKLEAALQLLDVNVNGLICLDVGASTGGFTDCLLQHGARRVYAVDVGYGQLAWKLRQDPRVIALERTNIRHLPADAVAESVDLVTIDASFISLRIVVPAALKFLRRDGRILALIKPQFEVGKGQVGKGGVVRDATQHEQVISSLSGFFATLGCKCPRVAPSPLLGPKGNREFFILLTYSR
jgi:23S rRNA (cytidine1920-2'-O)/16S rRNA (cytidine1409-2'-O)-methyltransferase